MLKQHDAGFRHFSNALYCAGAEEQRCPNGQLAGTCNWFKDERGALSAVTVADMNRTISEAAAARVNRRMPSDRFDPTRAGEKHFRYFGRDEAATCVRGKRVLFAGDSTTRDTFYEFMAVVGRSLFNGWETSPTKYWPDGAYEPRVPHSSLGKDMRGKCMGDFDARKTCLRDERYNNSAGEPQTRLNFQFLTRGNSSWEMDNTRDLLADRPTGYAFVQCPLYEWFKPDAYKYSLSQKERARTVELDNVMGPAHLEGIGRGCLEYIERLRKLPGGEDTQLFLLGITPLPGWTRTQGGANVEPNVFRSIHKALGLRCHRRTGAPERKDKWALTSPLGITPIDRYASVGLRRRDMIHPFFNAQFAIVQMILNHMCPAPAAHVARPRRVPRESSANPSFASRLFGKGAFGTTLPAGRRGSL